LPIPKTPAFTGRRFILSRLSIEIEHEARERGLSDEEIEEAIAYAFEHYQFAELILLSADHRPSAGRQWPALLFCPAIEHMFYRGTALYHIPHRSALSLEFD